MSTTSNTGIIISVVIVTHNRVEYLKKAINGLSQQSLDKNLYEILVVDNHSKDNTKQVVYDLIKSIQNLKYIYESKIGANYARNTGWQQAKGKYVAYIDDDAIPSNIWLERIKLAFENVKPVPGIVGGKVNPIWESEKPAWITGRLLKALSVVDYSIEPTFLEDKDFVYSVNMCFQRDLLTKFGGFDVKLGRKGKLLTSNDEILIAIKIRNAGFKVYYDPLMAVDHLVPSSRLNYKWFVKRAYQQGYSNALMWKILEKPNLWACNKKIMYYVYGFFRNPWHVFQIFYTPSNPERFIEKLNIHIRLGYIRGLLY